MLQRDGTTGRLTMALATVLWVAAPATLSAGKQQFIADLVGIEEVPANSTPASGTFQARLSRDGAGLEYELSYSDLSSPVSAAHIHVGQAAANGGVAAFLCGGGGKPACPASGTVTGVILAADVTGPGAQGLAAGELGELLELMSSKVTYVNVHTATFPGGEIRGQVR